MKIIQVLVFLASFSFLNFISAEEVAELAKVTPVKPVKTIRLGGTVEVRYDNAQHQFGSFSPFRFEPYVESDIDDDILIKGQILVKANSKIEIGDALVQYNSIPFINGSIKAGKYRWKSFGLPQSDSERVSVDYSLTGRAFTGDRQVGIEYYRKSDYLNLGLGLFNGSKLDSTNAGDNRFTPISFISDKLGESDKNQDKDITMRLELIPVKGLQIGTSALAGKLTGDDLKALTKKLGTAYTAFKSKTDRKKQRIGGDIVLKSNLPVDLKGEYIYGTTSEYNVDSWSVLAISRSIFTKLDIYSRYSQLVNNLNEDANKKNTYTFDLYQTTCGVIWNFNKMTLLQIEYEFNNENNVKLNNDILRIRWQGSF
ncbi:MAG: hypothetical protein HY934_03185 [Candidatus Firestonebacteria bacterium]|nr:hypothetical protein [Candidatus Firestonebacteria bacterium]